MYTAISPSESTGTSTTRRKINKYIYMHIYVHTYVRYIYIATSCLVHVTAYSNIAFGIYRYPYDASLRHRQFNPFYVRNRFVNSFSEAMSTGVRRKKGEGGKREVKQRIIMREVQALGGVVLVEDPLSVSLGLMGRLMRACTQ